MRWGGLFFWVAKMVELWMQKTGRERAVITGKASSYARERMGMSGSRLIHWNQQENAGMQSKEMTQGLISAFII